VTDSKSTRGVSKRMPSWTPEGDIQELARRCRSLAGSLEEVEGRYHALLDTIGEGVVITQDGINQYANRAVCEMTGWAEDEIVGMPPLLKMVIPVRNEWEPSSRETRVDLNHPPERGEYRIEGKNGIIKHVEIATLPIVYEGRKAFMSVVRDITQYRRIEVALLESEEKFRVILDSVITPIVYYDLQGNILLINIAGATLMGGLPDDFIGKRVHEIFPKEGKGILQRVLRVAERGEGAEYEDQIVIPFGDRWFLSTFQPVRDAAGNLFAVQTISYDVTERKRLSEAWRDLSRRLVEAQEQERRNVARELHDQIGQNLTALKLLLGAAMSRPTPENRPVMEEARKLIDELVSRVREISLDLRPSMLDDLGLLPSLLWLFERYTSQTGVRVSFKHKGLDQPLPPDIATAAYRITQESLTNVARHAKTDQASVTIMADGDALTVHVRDEGMGFDLEAARASGMSSGLIGMRERAVSLHGELKVSSMPGHGTDVVARIPMMTVSEK